MDYHCKRITACEGEISLILLLHLSIGTLLLVWCVHSAWQLAGILRSTTPEIPVVASDSASVSNSDVRRASVDITALKAIALFGAEEIEPVAVVPAEVKEEVLEETKLNLVLKGLFTANNKDSGQAIIANGRDENLYQVDDEIEGLSQVSLLEVFADRVRLSNRGKAEVLYLYPEGERISPSASIIGEDQLSGFLESSIGDEQALYPGQESSSVGSDSPEIKKLSQIIRVVRERDKSTGDMVGFRVLPGRDRAGFDQSGLQANDIITTIDGEKLTDLRSAMTIYRNKRGASQVSLMVSRQGSELSIDIDLSRLQ